MAAERCNIVNHGSVLTPYDTRILDEVSNNSPYPAVFIVIGRNSMILVYNSFQPTMFIHTILSIYVAAASSAAAVS